MLFERGVNISHETVRVWYAKFGPDLAEALRHRRPRRGKTWHLDEMRVVLGGVAHWLWQVVNEYGDVLDVLLQENRDTGAAKRFFRRLIREQERQQRDFRTALRTQRFLFTHTEVSNLFRHTRARTSSQLRRCNLTRSFGLWAELSLAVL